MKPQLYCASKLYRGPEWRYWKAHMAEYIDVISTWHDSHTVMQDESNDAIALAGWEANRIQLVRDATHVIAWGAKNDPLNGTLIELGMAIGRQLPIILVGDYPWGTWRHLRFVRTAPSIDEAFSMLVRESANDAS